MFAASIAPSRLRRKMPPGLYAALFFWIIGGVALAYISSAETDAIAQVYFSAGILAAFFIFKWVNPKRRVPRICFLVIATFVVLRYLFWRTLYTIEFTDWLSFSCAILLYVAELYGIAVILIGNIVNASPITRTPVPLPAPEELPTIDVFVPSYNESEEMLEVTLIAASQMRYPKDKLNIYLCDDGGTDQKMTTGSPEKREEARLRRLELQALCERLGLNYLTRARNLKAKAGNVNEAFAKTSGDLIVIFDADHVPTEDFLEKTVGLFLQDPRLFLVQTPHFFVNPDPIEKNLDTFYQMPSENEMFYRVIQKGLDYWNASFFCGSGAILRRSILDKTGGLSGDTITEDAETALTLHSMGYNSAYISTPLLSGLAPETMGALIVQRTRWAQGMVQILLLKCPLFLRGLTLPQRLCYFNSCLYWFFPFARLAYLIAPTAFLIFGLRIYAANWQTFCAFVVPYMVVVFGVANYLYGKVRWAFVSDLYELLQSIHTLPAIIGTFFNPRKPSFAVTPKGETLDRDFISPLATPFYFLTLLNFVAVGFGIYHISKIDGGSDEIYPAAITLFWGIFNSVLLLATLGALFEKRQRRSTPRMPCSVPAECLVDDKTITCRLADLSIGGCLIAFETGVERLFANQKQGYIRVKIGNDAEPKNLRVKFVHLRADDLSSEVMVSAQFDHESDEEVVAKVRLVRGSSARWVDFWARRQSKLGVVASMLSLMYLGLASMFQHLWHLLSGAAGNVTGSNRSFDTRNIK